MEAMLQLHRSRHVRGARIQGSTQIAACLLGFEQVVLAHVPVRGLGTNGRVPLAERRARGRRHLLPSQTALHEGPAAHQHSPTGMGVHGLQGWMTTTMETGQTASPASGRQAALSLVLQERCSQLPPIRAQCQAKAGVEDT